jgi:hypothetical protein
MFLGYLEPTYGLPHLKKWFGFLLFEKDFDIIVALGAWPPVAGAQLWFVRWLMPVFRVRLQDLPEQPGERRISVHWFFLPLGLILLAIGVVGLGDYFLLNGPPFSIYWGSVCAFFGVFELLTFVLCRKRIHEGRPPQSLFTIRVRQLILFGSMAGYIALPITIFRFLPGQMAWAISFVWVLGGGLIWNGIIRYFRKHPPKH